MAEANKHDHGPVVASSNRYLDIEPYCGRIYNTEYHTWRDILPWEFPQSASKDVEEAFLKHYFTEREIYIEGGDQGGYRFLKQVWYCIALWNYQIKIPKVADAWMLSNENIIDDAALRGHLLSPEAEVSAFFSPQEIYTYGEKVLGQVIGLIQHRVAQLTANDHSWHAASRSGTTTNSISPPVQAASVKEVSSGHINLANSDTPLQASNTGQSSRMQTSNLAIVDRPVLSLSPVPEDLHRPRAESSTQPQLPPVQVRKHGNSFSRVQQNISRSTPFMPRPQQQYQHPDMHHPQQSSHFNSSGPTIGNLPPYTAQQQDRFSSSEHIHPLPAGPDFTQGLQALPGSGAPPHMVQQLGPHDFVNGPSPPSGYLPSHVELRDSRHASEEQYFEHRYDDGRFHMQPPLGDKRGTNRHTNSRRDSYSTRGNRPRAFSNSRGKPYSGRNSFSSGHRNSEAFFQGSGDARYDPTFLSEDKRRRNSNFSNDWRANAQGDQRRLDENFHPSRDIHTHAYPADSAHQANVGLKKNTASPPTHMPTSEYPLAPSQHGFGAPARQGQGYVRHETELGYDPGPTTAHIIASGCTYITRLVVFDVPPSMTEADARQYFEAIGRVKSVSLGLKQPSTAPRIMWITFQDHQTTVKALALNGTLWPTNHVLRIEVPKEYWDPTHHKFPGSDHPDYRRHFPFKNSNDFSNQHARPAQPTNALEDARSVKPVVDGDTTIAKFTDEPAVAKEILSSSTTPNASNPSTPKKKSKPKRNKNRQPREDVPGSAAETETAPEATSTTEHVSTVKEVMMDEDTSEPHVPKASADLAEDGTAAHLSAHDDADKHELRRESEESQAKQSHDPPSTTSVTNAEAFKESQGADVSPQQPFRAQTPTEAKTTVSGSASAESAGSIAAITLDSNETKTGSSSSPDGGRDAKVIVDTPESAALVSTSPPMGTPAAAQRHGDDGVDESFHTAIESIETTKQQKNAGQPIKPGSSTAEPTHTVEVPRSLLSVKSRREDRGTDETTSSAVTADTTIHTSLERSHDSVSITTEQTEQHSAEDVHVASPNLQTMASQARSPASGADKKAQIPLLMIKKAVSVHTDNDASPKLDDLPTPRSMTSPTSPDIPAATLESPMQQSMKSSAAALPLPPTQTKVEKLKGPAKTESLSMFAKKEQTSKPKKSKPQKGKGSIRGKSLFDNDGASSTPSPIGSRATSIAADASPQDVLDQEVTGGDRASIDSVMESADTQSAGPLTNSTLQSAQGVGGIPRQRPELQSWRQTDTSPEPKVVDKNSRAAPTSQQSSNKSPGSESNPKQSRSADHAKCAVSSTCGSPSSSRPSAPTATAGSDASAQGLFRTFRESDTSLGIRNSGDSGGAVPDETGSDGTGLDPTVLDVGMTDDEKAPVDELASEDKGKKKSRKSGRKKKKGKSKVKENSEEARENGEQDTAQQNNNAATNVNATAANSSTTHPALITLSQPPRFMFNFGEDKKAPSTAFLNKTTTSLAIVEDPTSSPTAVSATSSRTFGRPSDTSGDNTPSSTAAVARSADSPISRVQSLIAARQQQQLRSRSSAGVVTAAPNRNVMAKRQHAHKKRASKSSDSSSSSSSSSSSAGDEGKGKQEGEGEGEGNAIIAGNGDGILDGRRGSAKPAMILRSAGLSGIGALDSVLDAMRAYRSQGGPGTLLIYDPVGSQDIEEENEEAGGWTGMVEEVDEEDDKGKG